MSTTETWNDPNRCPFCDEVLASPGAGFVAHIESRSECADAFGRWRDRIGDDVAGGWSG
ncbi:hypothetical protein EGH21_20130 [Halomicroarcula sp. F13]|uniref:Uncharacterized protein n=1 Tax=Haloarcula rubra TaxID=2487747 RepID=A0AAW4PVX7_9EURY|nr:hypothetical protein [Halomicroarcula rubra]MBX0325339.1 hypothetical protein [Halomicroarcula rubra]